MIFISNFVLWEESGYFDNAAETKPLLHLWSLSVEEQFYIVYPFLIWFAWKRQLNLLTVTITSAIVSLFLNLRGIEHDAIATFYSLQTRFWELMSGSILAWVTLYNKEALKDLKVILYKWLSIPIFRALRKFDGKALANFAAFIGLLLLIYGFFRINKGLSFPGKWALVPVLGSILIIIAGQQAWVNRKILSNRILVWFGLISFPLYLWHWVLLSFARIVESETPNTEIRIACVLLSICLAWLTFKFIEKPIRLGKYKKRNSLILIVLALIIGLLGYHVFIKHGYGTREHIQTFFQLLEDDKMPIATRESDGSCQRLLDIQTPKSVVCLTNSANPEIMFVGDSHAMALNSSIYTGNIKLATLLIGAHGCPPLLGYYVTQNGKDIHHCDDFINQVLDALSKTKSIKTVVINSRGPYYFTGEGYGIEGRSPELIVPSNKNIKSEPQVLMFLNGHSKFIAALKRNKIKVVFVIDPPELGEDPAGCLYERPITITKGLSNCTQSRSKAMSRQSSYRNVINSLSLTHPLLKIYDTLPIFCDDSLCYGIRDNNLLYWDDDHISLTASALVITDMLNRGLLK